jgi:hypothetical protein
MVIKFTSFMGIEVSKKTIDAAIDVWAAHPRLHQQFDNRPSGFKALLTWVTRHCAKQALLFCFAHTGIYATMLLLYSAKALLLAAIWMASEEVYGHSTP